MIIEKVSSWAPLGGVSFEDIAEARRQAHNAVQWLARFTRSYLPPSPDDSHTGLIWNPLGLSFDTGAAEIDDKKVHLCFDFESLSIKARTELGAGLGHIELHGLSNADVQKKLKMLLKHVGFDPDKLQIDIPYDLGDAEFTAEDRYDGQNTALGLAELARYFGNADGILEQFESLRSDAGSVRCWPHHFDIATLITVEANNDPEQAKTLGVGLSPGDSSISEPYFYATPWPYPNPKRLDGLPDLPEPAYWHTKGFVAAIIPSKAMRSEGAETRLPTIVGEAIEFCEELLNN